MCIRDRAKAAANSDGTFRLAFDQEGSTSMKYNMVWDRVWGSHIFPEGLMDRELKGYVCSCLFYTSPLTLRPTTAAAIPGSTARYTATALTPPTRCPWRNAAICW